MVPVINLIRINRPEVQSGLIEKGKIKNFLGLKHSPLVL